MIIKAKKTDIALSIVKGTIYDSEFPEKYKDSLCKQGFAIEIQADEVKEMPIDDYQEKAYPNNMLVFNNGKIYRADVGQGNFTSTSFIYSEVEGEPSEWVLKINGN